ncbi:MAG: sialate O-acetylesterase [Bacteroidota bacterium]
MDSTFVNGKFVGSINEWNADRKYSIDASFLQPGKNIVVVKVKDTGGGGGIYGKPEQLFVEADGKKVSLAGEWWYKPSVLTADFGIKELGPNAFPSQLYNAMIAPVTRYAIKGGIWYQGESNAYEAYKYRTLFAELINNWRSKWGYEFPFFWVQLANFMKPALIAWAERMG